jgi:hypothetical protein
VTSERIEAVVETAEAPELGRLLPPYGGQVECVSDSCRHLLDEERGAYLYRNLESGKLCVFCGHCSEHVSLNHPLRFRLVAL